MTIVFITATGEIIQTSAEDIDTSGFDLETYTVLTGHSGVDVAGAVISPRTHVYENGAFVAIPAADLLAAAKYKAQGSLLVNVNRFIEAKPAGETRYDQNLKFNLMQAAMDAMAAGQAVPTPVTQVRTWISAVQSAYFERKQAIAAAVDQAALEAVDISYGWFEALFGVAGTAQPDPDIYTTAIVS